MTDSTSSIGSSAQVHGSNLLVVDEQTDAGFEPVDNGRRPEVASKTPNSFFSKVSSMASKFIGNFKKTKDRDPPVNPMRTGAVLEGTSGVAQFNRPGLETAINREMERFARGRAFMEGQGNRISVETDQTEFPVERNTNPREADANLRRFATRIDPEAPDPQLQRRQERMFAARADKSHASGALPTTGKRDSLLDAVPPQRTTKRDSLLDAVPPQTDHVPTVADDEDIAKLDAIVAANTPKKDAIDDEI